MTSASESGVGSTETETSIFTNFQGYVSPTEADYLHCFDGGLVVLDANVLLDLYRYSAATRRDFLAALGAVRDQLWVPHQALAEFWRNREGVMRNPRGARQLLDDLKTNQAKSEQAVRSWANRLSLPEGETGPLYQRLNDAFQTMVTEVARIESREGHGEDVRTQDDSIVNALDELLKGRVGRPLDEKGELAARKEATRRVAEKIPPGYKDRGKTEGDPAGDYLVWCQLLRQAKATGADALLVTGDEKEDWWRREAGRRRGPRPELAEEFQRETGARLFMLTPSSFLVHVTKARKININPASVDVVQRIDAYSSTKDLRVDLLSLSVSELEQLVGRLLQVIHSGRVISGPAPDVGVDFIIKDDSIFGFDIPVTLKLGRTKLSSSEIIETARRIRSGALEDRAIIIAIPGFTHQALQSAKDDGRIQLISGQELARLLKQHLSINAVLTWDEELWSEEKAANESYDEE